ncbi:hypothetical protein [Polynucleobacter asymbioticus]|uniref:hypothetical protein n=1 Tax=Polynucleobacter asymbioticus TaxID=576611 RepID=UPI0008F80A48|nr:hypothetical protein [Polynucleobacter asymbioticus]
MNKKRDTLYIAKGEEIMAAAQEQFCNDLQSQNTWKDKQGRYTIDEAIEAINSKLLGEVNISVLKDDLKRYIQSGGIVMYEPGKTSPMPLNHVVRAFYEEAYWSDLNNWLSSNFSKVDYRFIDPANKSKNGKTYTHKPMQRYRALSELIEPTVKKLLKINPYAKPTARQLVECWKKEKPAGLDEILVEEIVFTNSKGDEQRATMIQISNAIDGLIQSE